MEKNILLNGKPAKIIDRQTFRSSSLVNQTDDMVRLTIDISIADWRGMVKSTKTGDSK
jgi:hypothetical protein